jgi:hypothetical protein
MPLSDFHVRVSPTCISAARVILSLFALDLGRTFAVGVLVAMFMRSRCCSRGRSARYRIAWPQWPLLFGGVRRHRHGVRISCMMLRHVAAALSGLALAILRIARAESGRPHEQAAERAQLSNFSMIGAPPISSAP